MEDYYQSWTADMHGGKLDVACVDCHYAPGEQTTIKAKLRGLSQVTSYFSGRYGTSRPRAHVDNRSCLTSKCHGDMKFMEKDILLSTVKFRHAKHLQGHDEKLEEARQELAELSTALKGIVSESQFEQLDNVAQEVGPGQDRIDEMAALVRGWGVQVERQQLAKLSQLRHREVRIAQLASLQCTNCHSYVEPPAENGDAAHHFTVKTTSCYTCHFNNEEFNAGTGSCLLCHSLPTTEILVHKELSQEESTALESPELTENPIRMDHRMILERKVDCIACHADVSSEDSTVTRRDCYRCHDRPEYFAQWKEPFTLGLVEHYHEVHVPEQRAKCLDCHSEIHHQLIRDETPTGEPAFLSSVMANCTHCHPNQHAEQIDLLRGAGGTGVPQSEPNLMFGSRTNCFGCHVEQATAEHGGELFRGAVSGCVACHGEKHSGTFEKWKQAIELSMLDAEDAYQNARQMLESAENISDEKRRQATDLLGAAQADLRMVKRGNGVHNVTYAIELLDSVTRRCQEAMAVLTPEASESQ
jgi:hypothetical protein